ncbi:hypothetical protein AO371_0788 [Moraxella catarrhalis]|nr:hypothetical protein AO371_0788 [Moraxella catarrhalis]
MVATHLKDLRHWHTGHALSRQKFAIAKRSGFLSSSVA